MTAGTSGSIHHSSWPDYDADLCVDNTVTIAVQINGKLRGTLDFAAQTTETEILDTIKSTEIYKKWIGASLVKKTIYIPGKIVNIIV